MRIEVIFLELFRHCEPCVLSFSSSSSALGSIPVLFEIPLKIVRNSAVDDTDILPSCISMSISSVLISLPFCTIPSNSVSFTPPLVLLDDLLYVSNFRTIRAELFQKC